MTRALREGYTTGTCAAAAARAAALALEGLPAPAQVAVELPGGRAALLEVEWAHREGAGAAAAVRKDAGDDPDVTHRCLVVVTLEPLEQGDLVFAAGEGVGTVTKPGLQVPPGEPAINPVPRELIRRAVRDVTSRPLRVTVAVPGGEALAAKTFNPRLGIVGGLSILGTTGVVRPFSHEAIRDTVEASLAVARACGVDAPVLVPGHVGERAARRHLRLADEQVVEVSNEWGYALGRLAAHGFGRCLALGHPGKLAKLARGDLDTHSSRSATAAGYVADLARRVLGRDPGDPNTVEGVLRDLPEDDRRRVAGELSARVRAAVEHRAGLPAAVALVNLEGDLLATAGDLTPWDPSES
ncbi:MAG: cobalt-precorrin-5B (C(1))-methyltransferase CbiD [Deferrisomatales bacterium]